MNDNLAIIAALISVPSETVKKQLVKKFVVTEILVARIESIVIKLGRIQDHAVEMNLISIIEGKEIINKGDTCRNTG